jgi:hypothetical protein
MERFMTRRSSFFALAAVAALAATALAPTGASAFARFGGATASGGLVAHGPVARTPVIRGPIVRGPIVHGPGGSEPARVAFASSTSHSMGATPLMRAGCVGRAFRKLTALDPNSDWTFRAATARHLCGL